jgi:serine/threonine protein phosphatase PrpC
MSDSRWRTVGLAVPGAAHVAQGRDGDDAFGAVRVSSSAGEAVFLALADGVGARRFSGGAARLAVHAALDEVRRGAPLPGEPAQLAERCLQALAAAQRAVDLIGSLTAEDVPPPACTLLLAVAVGDVLVCLAVGDGAIVHLTHDDAALMPITAGPDDR